MLNVLRSLEEEREETAEDKIRDTEDRCRTKRYENNSHRKANGLLAGRPVHVCHFCLSCLDVFSEFHKFLR